MTNSKKLFSKYKKSVKPKWRIVTLYEGTLSEKTVIVKGDLLLEIIRHEKIFNSKSY